VRNRHLRRGLHGAEFGDGEGHGGHQLLVRVDDVLRNFPPPAMEYRQECDVDDCFRSMGDKIGTVRRTIDGDFALGAAADCANLLAFAGQNRVAFRFSQTGQAPNLLDGRR